MSKTAAGTRESSWGVIAVLAVVVLIAAAVIAGIMLGDRTRKRGISAMLQSAGWTATLKPTDAQRDDMWNRASAVFSRAPEFDSRELSGANRVRWCAHQVREGKELCVFEIESRDDEGRSFCVVVMRVSRERPVLHAETRGLIKFSVGARKGIAFEDEAFTDRWRVESDSAEYAQSAMNRTVREALMRLPRGCLFVSGPEGLMLIRPGKLDADRVDELVDQLTTIHDALPKE